MAYLQQRCPYYRGTFATHLDSACALLVAAVSALILVGQVGVVQFFLARRRFL
jgi:hypothetical protein